jgi:hypothetical protein
MGQKGSKAAGGVASAATKTAKRSLPKAGDAAATPPRTLLAPVFRDPDAVRKDDAEVARHKFFRPVTPNDGTLAPMKPAKVVDVAAMVAEKDVRLVQRMDQLAGAISMSRLEISGHKRAREMMEARRKAAENQRLIKIADAAVGGCTSGIQ